MAAPSAPPIPDDDDTDIPIAHAVPVFTQHVRAPTADDDSPDKFKDIIHRLVACADIESEHTITLERIYESLTILFLDADVRFLGTKTLHELQIESIRTLQRGLGKSLLRNLPKKCQKMLGEAMDNLAFEYELKMQRELGPRYRNTPVFDPKAGDSLIKCDFGLIETSSILHAWRAKDARALIQKKRILDKMDIELTDEDFNALTSGEELKRWDRIEVYGIYTHWFGKYSEPMTPPRVR